MPLHGRISLHVSPARGANDLVSVLCHEKCEACNTVRHHPQYALRHHVHAIAIFRQNILDRFSDFILCPYSRDLYHSPY